MQNTYQYGKLRKGLENISFMEGVNGARYKIRTCDHLHVMEALYR
jgi:hypothetical protein